MLRGTSRQASLTSGKYNGWVRVREFIRDRLDGIYRGVGSKILDGYALKHKSAIGN